MPQDAFHIRRIAQELQETLVGGKVNRVSQVDKDELTLIIYTGKRTVKLILSTNASNARVCLSAQEKEPAAVPPNFCMLLRKHLQGAEILAVRQHAFERIIELDFHCTTDFSEAVRTLHCELMGKYSNVVLSENGIVLSALKTTTLETNVHRVILTGAKYVYPTPQEKISPFDGAGLRSRLQNYLALRENPPSEEDLALFLFENVSGLAIATAREMILRAKAQANSLAACLTSAAPLWDFVGDFCENEPNRPCVTYEGSVPKDFFAFPVKGGVPKTTLAEAEDEFYSARENKKSFESKKRKLDAATRALKKKGVKKRQDLLERLQEADKAEVWRLKGELLTANLYRIERGVSRVTLENWYDEKGGTIDVQLDPTLSPSKNAQRYFKSYNKAKRTKEVLAPMLDKEERELAYLDTVLFSIESAERAEDLQEIETELVELGALRAQPQRIGKKKDVLVPFREFEHDGKKILVGRNNVQNDRLLRLAEGEDLWLHTQKYHSAHVIIQTRGGQVCDETLLYAAKLCAYYSDGRGGDKIPVDYCKRKFVKKPNKAKAGFVTYTDYKTLLVTPELPKE